MMNCKLQKNKNQKICKIPKSDLTWKQAKKIYPNLKPYKDSDGDGVINKKDCRPFNKRRQDECLKVPDRVYEAYEVINYGRALGFSPESIHEHVKKKGFSSDEMRDAGLAYTESRRGKCVKSYKKAQEDSYMEAIRTM